jgi:hypothetical protein
MTKAAAVRRGRVPRDRQKRKPGRPKGSTILFERDRQRFTIAALWGFRLTGAGPYTAAYWASIATTSAPLKPEDVEQILVAAGVEIPHTAVTLDKHFDHLLRKADRISPDSDAWLQISALTIKALVLAARTGNLEVYCGMLDLLVDLGWGDVIEHLSRRIIEASRSNLPPFEGNLGAKGRELLARLRITVKKP